MHKVAILGATGMVGQRFIQLLEHHPWFEVAEICGFSTVGKKYGDAVNWTLDTPIPKPIAEKIIKPCTAELESKIVFSAIPGGKGDIEKHFAEKGHHVFSNTRDHRMDPTVPLVIPEINAQHLELIKSQNTPGYIVTNPNCSTIGLMLGVAPLHKKFSITGLAITTMQAISGAGHPGIPSLDIMGNIIPYIGGEEEKIQTETKKILGNLENNSIKNAEFPIIASCYRVPVIDGHTIDVTITFKNPISPEEIAACLKETPSLQLPSAPNPLIHIYEEKNRPQPRLDLKDGMSISIGRIRSVGQNQIRMTLLSHNTIRGAAGCSILNAELLTSSENN